MALELPQHFLVVGHVFVIPLLCLDARLAGSTPPPAGAHTDTEREREREKLRMNQG